MRLLLGKFIGMGLGALTGATLALLAAILCCQGNTMVGAVLTIVMGPVSLFFGGKYGLTLTRTIQKRIAETTYVGKARRRFLLRTIGIPIWFFFNTIVASVLMIRYLLTPSSDDILLANFKTHQGTFERLGKMVQADKALRRIDEDWTDPSDPNQIKVTPERIVEYRQLLRQVGMPRGFSTTDEQEEVYFYYWLVGSSMDTHYHKGYAYLKKPPTATFRSLDNPPSNVWKVKRIYRPIEGNWYLFYEVIQSAL